MPLAEVGIKLESFTSQMSPCHLVSEKARKKYTTLLQPEGGM